MSPLLALFLNRYTIGGIAILTVLAGIFWAGNIYGPNARHYADCKAETARRNDAIDRVNKMETARHANEEAARLRQIKAFADCPGIQQCLLTKETAACLNLLE